MQTLIDYHEDGCPWYYFDNSYKTLLGACLIVFGVFGVLLNGWLFATFIHSHLLTSKSHILVMNLCSASLGRNLLGFPFSGSSAIAKRCILTSYLISYMIILVTVDFWLCFIANGLYIKCMDKMNKIFLRIYFGFLDRDSNGVILLWLFGSACCQLFAFLNQFFGIFQITALFALVLERYLLARRYRREKTLYFRFYWIIVGVCWVNSLIFATPPLFGYGVYACDSTGTTCSLLWPSLTSGAKQLGYCIPYIIWCGLVPLTAIFHFMGKAVRLERIYYRNEHLREEKRLTKSIHMITIATLALWIPAGVLIGWQWVPLLIYDYRPHIPPTLSLLAPIASEAATSIPVLCYLSGDERLRAALLGRMRKQYGLLRPDRAQRYIRA